MGQPPITTSGGTQYREPSSGGGNGLAIASLILGILACITFCFWPLSGLLAVLAIVFGVIAMRKPASDGTAKTGLILGVVGIVLSIGFSVAILAIPHREHTSPVASHESFTPPKPRSLTNDIKARQDSDWGNFRIAFPYSMQVIAASSPYSDGSRTLLISEPPPDVTLDQIKAVNQAAFATAEIKTHTVGHDGWVRDIVVNLPPGTTDDNLNGLVAGLCRSLYGTEYGSYYLRLPIDLESLHTKYPLDLHVGIDSLRKWFTQTEFKSTDGTAVTLNSAPGGNYLSADPGLAAWVIPDGVDIANQRDKIRHFCLDSDLILGAAKAPNNSVIVLGRERIAPVDVLPPLRSETVILLAAAKTAQLSQSYERTAFFAGRFSGLWDWAPAYLSPQLLNSEYGTVLNIADQLLKSWSQHGETIYQNFPYPSPARYPFDQALYRELQTNSLLFNWNTKGVGFTVNIDGLTIYGLNRTGSLPVIYRPDQDSDDDTSAIKGDVKAVRDAEIAGYNFFASRNEPVLARVVQYAALYQTFQAFGSNASVQAGQSIPDGAQASISERLKSSLTDLEGVDAAKIMEIAQNRATAQINTLYDPTSNPDIAVIVPPELLKALIQKRTASLTSNFTSLQQNVQSFVAKNGSIGLDRACQFACVGRDTDIVAMVNRWNVDQSEFDAIQTFAGILVGNAHVITLWSDSNDARMAYSAAWNAKPDGWIHTQTIVVSRSIGEAVGGSGGHNLSATVTRVFPDESVPVGKPKIEEGGHVIRVNPKDVDAASSIVRPAVHEAKDPVIEEILGKRLVDDSAFGRQPDAVVLGAGDRDVRVNRGFNSAEHVPPVGGGGLGPPRSGPADLMPAPGADPPSGGPPKFGNDDNVRGTGGGGGGGNDGYEPPPPSSFGGNDPLAGLFIEKRTDGRVVIYRGTGDKQLVAEVWNAHDAHMAILGQLDAGATIADKRPLVVEFGAGYAASDREALLKSLAVQAQRYPDGQAVVAIGPLTPAEHMRLHGQLGDVVPERFHVANPDDGSQVARGSLQVTDLKNNKFRLTIEASYQPGVAPVSADAVNSAVGDVAKNAVQAGTSPLDLGLRVYSKLQQFSPGRKLKGGTISVPDAGDFVIVRNDPIPTQPATGSNEPAVTLALIPDQSANP